MKHFTQLNDIENMDRFLEGIHQLKQSPLAHRHLGANKTLGMLFFNPSLRTRLSTQKAAQQLGMHSMVMNFTGEGWKLEFEDGVIMTGNAAEHIREAAAVVSQYFDVLAVRAFASLEDKEKDLAETVIKGFQDYGSIPVMNLESATAHPLQALADAVTLQEFQKVKRPKVVLSWAPHPRALPHAVANSFVQMMHYLEVDFSITHPKGYALNPKLTQGIPIANDQEAAFENADFIYTKNWSAFDAYGTQPPVGEDWQITAAKMQATNNACFMHCLPVRRNVVVEAKVLDSPQSLVIAQANNRTYAAQAVLKTLLEHAT